MISIVWKETKPKTKNIGRLVPLDSFEPRHELSTNAMCATSKGSDQSVHTRSLIRAFACRLNIICVETSFEVSKLKRMHHRLA